MKKILVSFTVALLLAGCRTPAPQAVEVKAIAPADRAAMQTLIHTGRLDAVFAATISVLQDLGWKLETVDKPAGLIRAATARKNSRLARRTSAN